MRPTAHLGGDDATPFPPAPEAEGKEPSTFAGVTHHALKRGYRIPLSTVLVALVSLLVAIIGWTFVQDSGRGVLDTPEGLAAFVRKSLYITAFVGGVISLVIGIHVASWAKGRWVREWGPATGARYRKWRKERSTSAPMGGGYTSGVAVGLWVPLLLMVTETLYPECL